MTPTTLFIFAPSGFRTQTIAPEALAGALRTVFEGRRFGSVFDAEGGQRGGRLIGYGLADLPSSAPHDPTVLVKVPGTARGILAYGPVVVVPSMDHGIPRAATPGETAALTPAHLEGPWDLDLTALVAE